MNSSAETAEEHKLSENSRWIAALGTTAEFKAGWRAPNIFSDRSLFYILLLMLLHSCITGVILYLNGKGMISPRIKNLYAVSIFLTVQCGGLFALGFLNKKRALLITANMIAAVLWEYIFYENYKMLSPMFFINSVAIIYWTVSEPQLAQALGIRRDKILYDILISGVISLACFGYVITMLSAFGYTLHFDFWKNMKHSSILSSQDLLVFCLVYAAWRRLHDNGLSDTANLVVILATFLAWQIPVTIGYSLGTNFGFVKAVSAQLVFTFMLTGVAHYTFKNFKNVLPLVFVMTLIQEALLMTGLL